MLSNEQLLEMHDKVALLELVNTYARAADRQDFELMASLYEDDAIDEHGSWFSGPAHEYIARLREILPRWECTLHCVMNSVFKVSGARAEGEIYKIAYHRSRAPDAYEMVSGGRFFDRYAKRDGVWRFAHRRLVNDFNTQAPYVAPANAAELSRAGGADDPSYAFFSLFARGRR
jgi:hypothetical protein